MTVSEEERKALNETAFKMGAAMAILGVFLMILGGNFAPDPSLQLISFISGGGFAALGVVVLMKGGQFGEEYVLKKRAEKNYDPVADPYYPENLRGSFEDDERGIVWVWVVAFCTWAIMAIAYFSLSLVLYMVLDNVEAWAPWAGTSWESSYLGQIALVRNVCAWFLIIMTVGLIGWALINSARKEDQTYPTY